MEQYWHNYPIEFFVQTENQFAIMISIRQIHCQKIYGNEQVIFDSVIGSQMQSAWHRWFCFHPTSRLFTITNLPFKYSVLLSTHFIQPIFQAIVFSPLFPQVQPINIPKKQENENCTNTAKFHLNVNFKLKFVSSIVDFLITSQKCAILATE